VPLNNDPLPLSNVLCAVGIARLTNPNHRFVDTLVLIVILGAQVGFGGQRAGNVSRLIHSSALPYPEVRKGQVGEISESNLPPDYFCSPIGLVPKLADGIQH
jgi:hypothetical protein